MLWTQFDGLSELRRISPAGASELWTDPGLRSSRSALFHAFGGGRPAGCDGQYHDDTDIGAVAPDASRHHRHGAAPEGYRPVRAAFHDISQCGADCRTGTHAPQILDLTTRQWSKVL